MDVCAVCPQGCDTVDSAPNGTCPKYWQRPDGSPLCSQAWTCLDLAMVHIRIVGALFLLISLIYVRIIYYNYKKDMANTAAVSRRLTRESFNSRRDQRGTDYFAVSAGCFNQILSKMKMPPRTLARCLRFASLRFASIVINSSIPSTPRVIMICALTIRAANGIFLLTNRSDIAINCPACFGE